MADAHGVDTTKLTGTGPRGKVTKADVENALAGNGASAGGTATAAAAAAAASRAPRPPPAPSRSAARPPPSRAS